jgi:pyruvate kinase
MRRTKIVATLGPATNSPEQIAALIDAGMNVARLNFSHGTHAEHAQRIDRIRNAAADADKPIAILQDLQGPKIRTGQLVGDQPVTLVAGSEFVITNHPMEGTAQKVSTTYQMLPNDVQPGDRILISDGLMELKVTSKTDTDVVTEVISGGKLRASQGINLPGVAVSAPALTEKDEEDLIFGLQHDVDYIALSFVRRADDVRRVKEIIKAHGKNTPVIAKIEKPEALDVLPEILEVVDGLMVARGDLGVEMPPERVPIAQKHMIQAANFSGIPVITATQMLESMIQNPRPTRAETSDVANAIIDGTDAIMLSGETAMGAYPIEAVKMMDKIAREVEESGLKGDDVTTPRWALPEIKTTPYAIAAAAIRIAETLPVSCIAVFTQSGASARLVAELHPRVPIIAFTYTAEVYRRIALYWGVQPIQAAVRDRLDTLEVQMRATLLELGYAKSGDLVVMTGGHPVYRHGPTNFLKVIKID